MKSYKLVDQMGDSVIVSHEQLTAQTGQITLQVTETFMGVRHQAAVHVDPVKLVQAIIALGWEGTSIHPDE